MIRGNKKIWTEDRFLLKSVFFIYMFVKISGLLLTIYGVYYIIYLEIFLNSAEVILMGMNETLKAISDPVRRDILTILREGKKSAGEIGEHFNLTGATVSYHLAKLKKADLIAEEKQKNFIYYEINTSVFEDVLSWIYMLGGRK